MKKIYVLGLSLIFLITAIPALAVENPILVPYVGTISEDGEPASGPAEFKVAICTESDVTLWSNDGSSVSCSEPSDSVLTTLSDGVYSFMIGDTDLGMEALAVSVLNSSERLYLRTWFSKDSDFELFEPDIELGYSLKAGIAKTLQGYLPTDFVLADDQISSAQIADSAITASKLDDGAVTVSKISSFSNSGKTFTLGDASDANVSLVANLGSSSPAIRYNTSADQWEISNDGSSYSAIGSSGGSGDIEAVVAGAGLTGGAASGSATLDVGAGTGIAVAANSIGFDYTATQGLNPALNSGEAIFGTTGIIFEGSTADNNELLLFANDPSSDVIITLPNATGTLISTGSTGVINSSMMDTTNTFGFNAFSAKQAFFDFSTGGGGIVFEGATSDGNDGLLTVADPTAARTWTLPDTTGTIVTSGDTGTVNTTMLANNSVDGTKIALGSDAAGDIMYYNGTDWVRLAKGSNSEVLTLAAGLPSWAAASGGGISYTTKTVTTGVLAANGGADSEDFNITGAFNRGIVDYVIVNQVNSDNSVGNADYPSDQLRVVLYTSDAFSTAIAPLVGSAFSGYTMQAGEIAANTIEGFRISVGGDTLNMPVPFYDADATSELHLRVVNGDFSDQGKFKITLMIREIS